MNTKNLCLCIIILLVLNLYFLTQLLDYSNEPVKNIVYINHLPDLSYDITKPRYYNPYVENAFTWLTGDSVNVSSCFSKPGYTDNCIKNAYIKQENVSLIISQVKHDMALAEKFTRKYIKQLEDILSILQ